jgi:1-acyl-sn-glycerol-3-phosphate acyltransferase
LLLKNSILVFTGGWESIVPRKSILTNPYQPGDEHQTYWFDAKLVRFIFLTLTFWEKYFRYEVIGMDNIPKKGGVLLAMNHGFFFIDLPLLSKRIVRDSGRRIHTVAEHVLWKIPGLRELMLNLGVVDGTPKNALKILKNGHAMIVCPGGAKEAMRSSLKKYELMWDDHYGFIKVAIASGVPIVPCVSVGIDDAYVMLIDGYHRWKKSFIPLPIFFGVGPLPFPIKLRHFIGRPITHQYKPSQHKDMRCVKALHRKVLKEAERIKDTGLKDRKLFGFL